MKLALHAAGEGQSLLEHFLRGEICLCPATDGAVLVHGAKTRAQGEFIGRKLIQQAFGHLGGTDADAAIAGVHV